MANSEIMTLESFRAQAMEKSAAARAGMQTKQASAPTATDPTCQGEVSIPSAGDGANRSALNLPQNRSNTTEATAKDKFHNLMNVTKPDGVGQGSYISPQNGSAQNAAVNSFTAPLDKLAEASQDLYAASSFATADVPMRVSDLSDDSLMSKLAAIGQIMLGSEEGQQAVAAELEKEAGMREAQNIISQTTNMMYNQNYMAQMQQAAAVEEFNKQAAACKLTHDGWLNSFATDFEKIAYMQGAADGQAAAEAVQAGQDPTAAEDAPISEEEAAQVLEQMVQQGLINEQQLQALMQAAAPMAQDGLTEEELAQVLTQAMQAGEIDQQQAQQIAEMWLAENGAGGAPAGPPAGPGPEAGPMPGGPGPEEVQKQASYNAMRAANMIDYISQNG